MVSKDKSLYGLLAHVSFNRDKYAEWIERSKENMAKNHTAGWENLLKSERARFEVWSAWAEQLEKLIGKPPVSSKPLASFLARGLEAKTDASPLGSKLVEIRARMATKGERFLSAAELDAERENGNGN